VVRSPAKKSALRRSWCVRFRGKSIQGMTPQPPGAHEEVQSTWHGWKVHMGNFLDPIRWASPRKREHADGKCTIAVPMVSNVRRGREGNPRHPGRARRTDHNTRVMDSSCRTNEHALVQGRRPCKCRSVLVGITPAMPWNGSSCIRVKMLAAMRRPPSIVSTRKPHIFRVDDPALVSLDRDEPMRTCYTFFTFYNACESIESFRAYGLQGHLRRHWRDDPGKRFLLHVAKVKSLIVES